MVRGERLRRKPVGVLRRIAMSCRHGSLRQCALRYKRWASGCPPQYDQERRGGFCEAVTRPTMRFAPAKSAEQQSVLMLHRARELLVRQRTMVINALRGHCAELGLIVAQGASKVEELVAIEDPGDVRPPLFLWLSSIPLRPGSSSWRRRFWLGRSNQASRRLATIPGVGVMTATALVATIGDGAQFRSGPAALGLARSRAPDNTRVAARTGWGGSRSPGMAISVACSCMVREACCAGAAPSRARGLAGPTGS